MTHITFEMVKQNPEVQTYIQAAHDALSAIGFTEHGRRHIGVVARRAMRLLADLGRPARVQELAGIAALFHDTGNMVNRHDHGQSSAMIAFGVLSRMGMPPEEIATVVTAIGNHEEEIGNPVNDVCAALILADKSDVHRSRVYNKDIATFDIHDRVNYAVTHSDLVVDAEKGAVRLKLEVDTSIIAIMEYFEIFLSRMVICRRAAQHLGCHFELIINETRLL